MMDSLTDTDYGW